MYIQISSLFRDILMSNKNKDPIQERMNANAKGRMEMDKKNLTEEDIKLRFITPAITAKWKKDHITMETKISQNAQITDGKLICVGIL